MADNFDFTPGSGKTGAADDIGGVLYQRIKVAWGVDGSAVDASATNPFPVQLRGSGGSELALLTESDFDTKIGSLTEAAPASDTASSGLNGRLQRVAQRITSLIALFPAALTGSGNFKVAIVESTATVQVQSNSANLATQATAALQLTESDFDTKIGSLTEAAPASDTASSGLNGRLQRIAQRLTSLIALVPSALTGSGNFKAAVNEWVAGVIAAVGGNVAHDAADSGNPVKFGGRARSSEMAAVASDDRVDAMFDLVGKQVVMPYVNPENIVSGAITSAMTGTASTSLVAAPGAGLRNYITTIIVSNAHATVGTDIVIQDGSGGTTLMTIPAAAVYGGAVINLPVPLRQPTTNTAIYCANVTTGASTKVSAVGYKGV